MSAPPACPLGTLTWLRFMVALDGDRWYPALQWVQTYVLEKMNDSGNGVLELQAGSKHTLHETDWQAADAGLRLPR